MTALCVALVLWLALVAAVLIFPAFARIIGAAVLILLIATMAAAIAEERRVETPPQYRGAWCSTKWNTVYRRCKEFDDGWTLTINRQTVMSEDQVCELSAVRRGVVNTGCGCHVEVTPVIPSRKSAAAERAPPHGHNCCPDGCEAAECCEVPILLQKSPRTDATTPSDASGLAQRIA
jgi:hypothetical protein